MSFFIKKIKTEYATEYSEAMKKKYTEPKIYHGGKTFDLKKRWYVYFSFIDPLSGKMKRQSPIYLKLNQNYKTKKERLLHFNYLRDIVSEMLKKGHNPYENEVITSVFQAGSCLDLALSIKKKEIKETTYSGYKSVLNRFKQFINREGALKKSIKDINKMHVSNFLDTYNKAKTRNNARIALKSIFAILSDANYIDQNFISELRVRKVVTKKAVIFTDKQVNKIEKLLQEENPRLLMYIYFESYMFWRPIEIIRLVREDFDFNKNTISVETKTEDRKTKIIPELILNRVKYFIEDKKGFVFKSNNPEWHLMKESNRRQHYTNLWLKFRIRHNLSKELKLYSFKHTFITRLYLNLRKDFSKKIAIEKLSLITGHSSNAIMRYVAVNDLELPDDYSERLK